MKHFGALKRRGGGDAQANSPAGLDLSHLVPEFVQPWVVKHVALFDVMVLQGVALH